jgi:CRISPR-associated protein Cas1
MKETLYITSAETELKKDHESIVCTWPDPDKPGEVLKRAVPANRLGSIEFYGSVKVTGPVLQLCNELGIPAMFNSYHGEPVGMFVPASGSNPATRLAQYAAINDPARKLHVATRIIEKAIRERMQVVRKHAPDDVIDSTIELMEHQRSAVLESRDLDEARGHEGAAMRAFFDSIPRLLKYLPFDGRSRHPPEDEVNALLGYGNVMLYSTVNAEVWRSTLDPCAGFLHEPAGPRNSLALDIAEMFRPLMIDDLILVCDHQRIINASHFDKDEFKCYLNRDGKFKWIGEYKNRLERTVDYPALQRPVSIKEQIKLQCYRLIQYLEGETREYTPIQFDNW